MGNYGDFEEGGAEVREHGDHVGLKVLDILMAHIPNFDLIVVVLFSFHVFLDQVLLGGGFEVAAGFLFHEGAEDEQGALNVLCLFF